MLTSTLPYYLSLIFLGFNILPHTVIHNPYEKYQITKFYNDNAVISNYCGNCQHTFTFPHNISSVLMKLSVFSCWISLVFVS